MKKIVLLFFLMTFTFSVFSQYLDVPRARKSIEPAISQMDTAKFYAEKSANLLVKEYKMWGLKKTIQVNANVFLPIALFGILFLVWLKNKK